MRRSVEIVHGRDQIQRDGYRPRLTAFERLPLVPEIMQLEICDRGLLARVQTARVVDLHAPRVAIGSGLVLDAAGARDFGVPQCGSGRHKQRVVDVPRVGEDDEIEVEEPGFLALDDAEVWGVQGGVRKGLIQDRCHVVLQVFECA